MHSETFGELIRRLRLERKLALREVAAQIDFDQSTLSKIERNDMIAPQRIIKPLARRLQYDYQKLQIKYLSDKLFNELKSVDFPIESLDIARKRLEKEKSGTAFELERLKIIKKIRNYFRDQPIDKAWLFGSFAKDQQSLDSDLDILVRFVQPNRLDLFDYVGLSQDLEDLTGRKVDLVQEGLILPIARENIDRDKILIYERKAG